jgi:hypothetical protein
MGFPDLLDPSNGPEFFGRLYRDKMLEKTFANFTKSY